MSRIVGNTSLLDYPPEVRTLILEEVFAGLEKRLRIVRGAAPKVSWLYQYGDSRSGPLPPYVSSENGDPDLYWIPEILLVCKQIYEEGRSIYANLLLLKLATAQSRAEAPIEFSTIPRVTQDYYYPRMQRVQTTRLGLRHIPWRRMHSLQRVDMDLAQWCDGGRMVVKSGSCSKEVCEAYFMGARDQRLMRTTVQEAKQGRFGDTLQAMLAMKDRWFSLTITVGFREEIFKWSALVSQTRPQQVRKILTGASQWITFDLDTLFVLHRHVKGYGSGTYIDWDKGWIEHGTTGVGGKKTRQSKVRWVKDVDVAEDDEDCRGIFDWPEFW